MPKPVQYVRRVNIKNLEKIYSKQFEITAIGLRNAKKYESNTSKTLVSGEKLNYIINKSNKTIKIYTGSDFPLKFINLIGTTSLSRLKGVYKNSGIFYKGFGEIIKEIILSLPKVKVFNINFNKDSISRITKKKRNSYLTLNQNDYNYIHGLFQTEKNLSSDNSKVEIFKYLKPRFPKMSFDAKRSREIVSRDFKKLIFQEVLNNLNEKEVNSLLFELYEKYYDIIDSKVELFKETDTYKLDYIINEYESYLKLYKDDGSSPKLS